MTIEVRGDDGAYIQRQAVAYVGGSGEDAFTLPFTTPPSEAYLVAIRSHLRDHWDDVDQIDVRCAARGAVAQWSYPYQDPTRLDLASLCVEVNARRTAPWTMPAAIRPRCTALVEAGLTTTAEVAGETRSRKRYAQMDSALMRGFVSWGCALRRRWAAAGIPPPRNRGCQWQAQPSQSGRCRPAAAAL